ncbi:MAG: hypothetical protein SO253_05985 [Bacilli bacterium]|nr:hypothetical protein [Bacilli bacterium]
MLSRTSNAVVIISIVVIVLFAIVYFTLFKSLYNSKNRLITAAMDDELVKKQIEIDYKKYNKKERNYSFYNYYLKRKAHQRRCNVFATIFAAVLYIFFLAVLVAAIAIRVNGDQLFINGSSYLVIKTDSMETVNPKNDYISANNLNDRIYQYSLITIKQKEEIELYDIVAFKIDDVIIVHRVVEINEVDGNLFYTCRGDANPASLFEEIDIPKDHILGVYTGYQDNLLGHFVIYFQSGIGLISIIVALLVVLAYNHYYNKIERLYDDRYVILISDGSYDQKSNEENIENKQDDEDNVSEVVEVVETTDESLTEEAPIEDTSIEETSIQEENENQELQEVENSSEEHVLNEVNENNENFENENNEAIVETSEEKEVEVKEELPNVKDKQNEKTKFDVGGYSYTYFAKLSLADDDLRNNYNTIKNKIMTYGKVKNRFGKQHETFTYNGNKLFMISVKGKNIHFNMHLDPTALDSKYFIVDESNVRKYKEYPACLKVRSDRSLKYAIELIEQVAKDFELEIVSKFDYNYLSEFPKFSKKELIEKGEIVKK